MREYRADDGTMIRECKGCAGEYAIRTDEALESAGLVGEGRAWESVEQLREDLGRLSSHVGLHDGPDLIAASNRCEHAISALLSSGSNP